MAVFTEFEALSGGKPYRLLDSHPDARHLAMQAKEHPFGRSAIWDKETKSVTWKPNGAVALAWMSNGTRIGVLRTAFKTPYEFAIYTWPDVQLLHQCPISLPPRAGEMLDLIISPESNMAICLWIDQAEAGFEFIDITHEGVFHDSQNGYFLEGTNDITRPVFSPSGLLWVFGYKKYEIWWALDPEDIDTYDQPARGGEYPIGTLVFFHGKQALSHTIPLIATLPAGWLPEDPEAEEVISIVDPIFLDEYRIQVRLPSGETNIYQVPDAESTHLFGKG